MEIYKKIDSTQFLPELKKEYLTKINRRLESLKKDECRSLIAKLSKDTGLTGKKPDGIYVADLTRLEPDGEIDAGMRVIQTALDTYVDCSKYEYPIFVYDASKDNSGERGFAMTPDRIFYNSGGSSGYVAMKDALSIYAEGGLFSKGIFLKYTTGETLKLCGNVKNKDTFNKFGTKLTGFIQYLKEKPQSRSIEYMAKEKHEKKCCYRCGFTYVEGNICPKCGGKN